MFDLNGKNALVTGASGGIGSAIAKALAEQGARVALSGTREQRLKDVRGDLPGDGHIVLPANLSDKNDVDGLIPAMTKEMGSIEILINNAGITRDGLAMRMPDADWIEVMRVNLESAFRLARASLRPMMKARFGRIISIGSIVGTTGNPGQVNYAASKAGLIGMSKALAQEVASRNITVNIIAPGFIGSPMTDALGEEQVSALHAKIPAGQFGQGADIAAGAAFLASDEAGYITGQTMHINGGMTMV